MTHTDPNADAATLMRAQHGALHHRQALALGVSERQVHARLRTGAWHAAHDLVYVSAGAPATYETRCAAALLAVRHAGRWREHRPVALAGLSAAYLLGFDVTPPSGVRLVVPAGDTAPVLRGVRIVRATTWPLRAFAKVEGLLATSVADTIVDVARTLPPGRLLATVQEQAFARPGLPYAVLRSCRRGRAGSAAARRAAALVLAGVDSSLHLRGVALIRRAGLPAPACGEVVVRGAGPSDCVVALPGATAPPYGLAIEWDGDAHRVDRATFLHDREKDRLLRRAGYATLRYTDAQVRAVDAVVEDLRAEWARLSREVSAAS